MILSNKIDKERFYIYSKYIKAIASLSGLYSENKVPFLHYRAAENIFRKSFKAENLSRSDIAYDAKLKTFGIGIKTFIAQSFASREKISEFNTHSKELKNYSMDNLVLKLAELRNERIDFANRTYDISAGIYHCLVRQYSKIIIFNTEYFPINKQRINNIKGTDTSVFFEDNHYEYSYNFSKSTLYKKFTIPKQCITLDIKIISDPYELILKMFNEYTFPVEKELFYVILPLYSTRTKNKRKIVPVKSGLNQWNAGGRKRNIGEVYIPIPKKIHQLNQGFFPPKDQIFELILPTKDKLKAKICQEGGKALMTNPNKALSDWLLRKVLKLELGEVLTYNHLKIIGIDCVKVTKLNRDTFKIGFAKIDSYEEFTKQILHNKQHIS